MRSTQVTLSYDIYQRSVASFVGIAVHLGAGPDFLEKGPSNMILPISEIEL